MDAQRLCPSWVCEDARQVLHALDEPLDLSAPDQIKVDPLHDGIAFVLGFLIAAHQRIALKDLLRGVALVVLLLILCHS